MKYLGISIKNIIFLKMLSYLSVFKYYIINMLPNCAIINNTKNIKNTKKSKCAIVFANGPSLGKIDPYKVAQYKQNGFDIIAVNSYISSKWYEIVKPDIYVVSDPGHFGLNPDFSDVQNKQYAAEIEMITKANITLFLPVQYYHKINYSNKYAFCDSENIFSNNINDITKSRGYISATSYKALSIACYLGYDNIYVCGFDNDYFKTLVVDKDNNLYCEDVHFYDKGRPRRHVIPHQFGWGNGIGEALYLLHFLFIQLRKFSAFKIINLDPDSLVDCFSKYHDLDIYVDDNVSIEENDK